MIKTRFTMRLVCVSLLLLSSSSQASVIKLDYSLFFNYMKTMYKLDYQHVTTAFYLVDNSTQKQCHINQVDMVVDDRIEPILFQAPGRLLPFYSDQHRKDGGVLLVDIDDNLPTGSCNLQIKIMAKESELSNLDEDKLQLIDDQLEGVLNKNAGMVGKYFLPEFLGVTVKLSSDSNEAQLAVLRKDVTVTENGELLLRPDEFHLIEKINDLNLTVTRISPWLSKSV